AAAQVQAEVVRGPKGKSQANARGNLAATLPLEDHVLDSVIDGNKLPPGESAVDVVPATAAPRRRGLQRRRLADTASVEPDAAAVDTTPAAQADDTDATSETPAAPDAAPDDVAAEAAPETAPAADADDAAPEAPVETAAAAEAEEAPATPAKRTVRKRATATKKRVVKKTTAKKATK